MVRRIRRLLLLAAVVGAVGALLTRRAAAARTRPAAPPRWPPIEFESAAHESAAPDTTPVAAAVTTAVTTAATAPIESTATWVLPVAGDCPSGFPIKANDRSRIYHVPGGRSYERTVPERCYANPEDAAADGYRAAKA